VERFREAKLLSRREEAGRLLNTVQQNPSNWANVAYAFLLSRWLGVPLRSLQQLKWGNRAR